MLTSKLEDIFRSYRKKGDHSTDKDKFSANEQTHKHSGNNCAYKRIYWNLESQAKKHLG